VRRVAAGGGHLAVWTYHLPVITPPLDLIVERYYREVLGRYWPAPVHYIEQRYATLPFPFEALTPPAFEMQAEWELSQFVGFLESWSATARYQREQGQSPLAAIWPELAAAWGAAGQRRPIRWPLYLRVGRVA